MNLKDAIREAVDERDKQETSTIESPANQQAVNTVNSKAINTANPKKTNPVGVLRMKSAAVESMGEETAAMTVRVSRRHRLHWLISAKQQGTSLTAAITDALNARFGEPGD